MSETWTKHSFACDPNECDTLAEYTVKDTFGWPSGVVQITCPCGRKMNYLSVEPATILPMNERNEMETNTVPETYNANVLVTYKDIINGVPTYPTIKVNDLEWKLEQVKHTEKQLVANASQLNKITDNLSVEGWYNPNIDKEDILRDLCEILGHEPKQTIRITAVVNVEVEYDIPLEEVEDFDAKYFLQDNLTVDSWHGDVVIDSFDVEDADVNY